MSKKRRWRRQFSTKPTEKEKIKVKMNEEKSTGNRFWFGVEFVGDALLEHSADGEKWRCRRRVQSK